MQWRNLQHKIISHWCCSNPHNPAAYGTPLILCYICKRSCTFNGLCRGTLQNCVVRYLCTESLYFTFNA